ncbi:MAG: cupin domain-containing protein [Anaerolineae bacterium]
MKPMLVRSAEAKPTYVFEGIARRTLSWGEKVMVIQNTFSPGAGVPEHAHIHEQVSYVVEGCLVVIMEGTSYTLNAGDCLLMPSNLMHSASALSHTIVIEAFAPPREDFK